MTEKEIKLEIWKLRIELVGTILLGILIIMLFSFIVSNHIDISIDVNVIGK